MNSLPRDSRGRFIKRTSLKVKKHKLDRIAKIIDIISGIGLGFLILKWLKII